MPHPRFTNEEIARRGEEIYAARLRESLEKEHHNGAPLIGMTLLEESEVRFQGSGGGTVRIEPI